MLILLFLLLFPSLTFAQGIAPTLNVWTPIPNTSIHDNAPCPPNNFLGSGYDYFGNCKFVTAAWSSGMFDQSNDFLYIHGGGHADYSGNEIYKLDLNTLTISRQMDPSVPPAKQTSDDSPDCINATNFGGACNSNAKHTYDGLVWVESLHKGLLIGGSPAFNGGFTNSIWLVDPVARTWQRLTPSYTTSGTGGTGQTQVIGVIPSNNVDHIWSTCYMSTQNSNGSFTPIVYAFDQLNLYSIDPIANVMRSLTNRSTPVAFYMTALCDPVRKVVALAGGTDTTFATFDVTRGPTVQVPGTGDASMVTRVKTGATAVLSVAAPLGFYDKFSDKWVYWGSSANRNTIYVADPDKVLANASDTWSTITTTGAPDPSWNNNTNTGINKRGALSEKLRAIVYCGDVFDNCYSLRIDPVDNFIRIKETSGSTQTNRPIDRFARGFRDGDIPLCPVAYINGNPIQTQTDVKNRWPSGSLKFGEVSFIVPSMTASSVTTVTFVNGSTCNNTGGLSASTILASGAMNFDITMSVQGTAGTKTASARQMLSDGNYRTWATGPVMTEFILEDRANLTYDMDPNNNNGSLHPIYDCQFFPSINNAECSIILENAWVSNTVALTNKNQPITYSATKRNTSPVAAAINWAGDTSENMQTHFFTNMSRSHIATWVNTAPGSILIDHNLAYLATTGLINNFKVFSLAANYETAIANEWTGANKTIQGSFTGLDFLGNWQRNGADGGGGHPWIGLATTWDIQALYAMADFNQTIWDKMIGNADLHGRLQIHMRERDNPAGRGLYFDAGITSAQTNPKGRPVSIAARKSMTSQDFTETCGGAIGADQIKFASVPTIEWTTYSVGYPPHHAPSVGFIPYWLTGRYFYLEELQFEASQFLAWPLGCNANYRQANNGYMGSISSMEIRGLAWTMRSIAHAYAVSPDGTPEQTYYQWYYLQNNALLEGQEDVPISDSNHQAAYTFGKTQRYADAGGVSGVSPIGSMYRVIPDDGELLVNKTPPQNVSGCVNPGQLDCGANPWMENFLQAQAGEALDLGLNTNGFLQFRGRYGLGLVQSSSNLAFADQYIMPGKIEEQYAGLAPGQGWFPAWNAILQYLPPRTVFNQGGGSDQQYQYINLGAMGFLGGVSGVFNTDGSTAYTTMYNAMNTQLNMVNRWNGTTNCPTSSCDPNFDSPKWAQQPRTTIPPPTSLPNQPTAPNAPSNVTVTTSP